MNKIKIKPMEANIRLTRGNFSFIDFTINAIITANNINAILYQILSHISIFFLKFTRYTY